MRIRRLTVGIVVAIVVAAPLAGCKSPPPSYVALGDSFTSGPGILPQGTTTPGCFRSDVNYPHLIAPDLGLPVFRDASCSGAQTRDMTQPQDVDPDPDNAPQLNSLDANTRVVTLGIGGNDIGFTEIARRCVEEGFKDPNGSPCRSYYTSGGTDQIAVRIADLVPRLNEVLDRIDRRSPRAKVFVVGYPAILPETTTYFDACRPVLPIAKGDVAYLRDDVEKRLNATIQWVAVAHGEAYVDTYAPSIGHDVCQPPAIRWVEPLAPAADAFPVHPNRFGMEATARAVRATMRAHGVAVG